MPQFRLAALDLRWTGTDSNTPEGHVVATGFDSLGNYRVFLYAGAEPNDEQYVGSILIPKDVNKQALAYGPGGGLVTSRGNEGEKLTALVDNYARRTTGS